MNFYFHKLVLWLDNNEKRELLFKPNKVNVITGGSNTGKSAILQIINYCLFASSSKISESIINENVLWYGISIRINNKNYTICRKCLQKGIVSQDYYFSSSGENPNTPTVNSDEKTIKSLLETEFGIDHNVTIPFGSKVLRSGSKISLRYFLIFTTISEDIITNSSVYFDKQTEIRYREALLRIFDLAVGIDDIENILAKEKKYKIESDIKTLERKEKKTRSGTMDFTREINEISRQAKEFGLISPDCMADEVISAIREVINSPILQDDSSDKYSTLRREEYRQNRIIRNLKNLKQNYDVYKSKLKNIEDSILPISFLHKKKDELIKTSIYEEIVSALEDDLRAIKTDIKSRTPIDTNVHDLIHEHEQQIGLIRAELLVTPEKVISFNNDKEKYIFLGEIKEKLKNYVEESQPGIYNVQSSIDDLNKDLDLLHVKDISESKSMFIKLLEEIIQEYIIVAGTVLENYEKYHPVFDYTKKVLLLRKPLTDYIENVGSSSNHMFMHLFLFLGLHEVMQRKKVQFVPPYLIIDQPSRPYWGDGENRKEKLEHGDEAKVRKAFELLDIFVERITNDLKGSCQLIVFEHVPPSTWDGLDHVYLVEEFTNGNALIPSSYLDKKLS
ncbi:MAG: DUF3732 domain-containing protein [Methylobacter sp.]|nr:DUF3732 domain-containing protein [Methylobacter sp.]